MIKVLIVDDSAFMRKILSDILGKSDKITVIGKAKNGKSALKMAKKLNPDVITMDVEMPKMNGLKALEKIMDEIPTPVVMLSAVTKKGGDLTLEALELGAVDFITKPKSVFNVKGKKVKDSIIEKIIVASNINVKTKRRKKIKHKKIKKTIKKQSNTLNKIIALGTSTGGPRALQSVIPNIPADIKGAILIVQHMPPGFTKSLAERLDKISEIKVKEAINNEKIRPGHAYIAPGGQHLKLKVKGNSYYTLLDKEGLVSGHRPSFDAMLNSINKASLKNIIGVIMTGMGSDGAKGMLELNKNNNYTIAQDEESCVVFGMPKSAIEIDAINEVVELDKISNSIVKAMEV
ncbi:MAG: protein-glutamate methylesterase/protein-glutamine glutaminase [Bacillota bacterium]